MKPKQKAKILVTRPELFNKKGSEMLKRSFEVKDYIIGSMTKNKLLKEIEDVHGVVLLRPTEIVDKNIIDNAKKLRLISIAGVGHENVDVIYATKKGILVTICPVHLSAVADNAFALLICAARKIAIADFFVKSGKWHKSGENAMYEFMGFDIHHKTIGIIGMGRIGKEIAERARGFKMKILYSDKIKKKNIEEKLEIKKVSLKKLLKESDFIIVSCPLNRETYHLIDKRMLALMKPTSFIINTARGKIIDQKALYYVLSKNRIAGAGLDVFEKEPVENNSRLLKLDNIVMTPHIGPYTMETQENMSITVAKDIINTMNGRKPKYILNEKVFKNKRWNKLKI
jgi:D-3-phosphoglycerate dehydrogenase